MSTHRKANPLRTNLFTLWFLLFTAFGVVGGGACFFAYQGSVSRYKTSLKQDLANIAKLASLQVDAKEHESLVKRRDMETPAYKDLVRNLGRVQEIVPSIRYIYTIRDTGRGLAFIVDPTAPGDHDSDGIDDKSYLMDPYESAAYPVQEVLRTGRAVSPGILETDKWGTFMSGYAPIKDLTGRTVAVVGVDVEASNIEKQLRSMIYAFLTAFIFSLVLGAIVAFYIATHILRWKSISLSELPDKLSKTWGRTTGLQLFLACGVVICIGFAVEGHKASQIDSRDYLASNNKVDRLLYLRSQATLLLSADDPTPQLFELVLSSKNSDDNAAIRKDLERARGSITARSGDWKLHLVRAIERIDDETASLRSLQLELGTGIVGRQESYSGLFTVAALLALGALILVRAATIQQEQLAKTAFRAGKLRDEVALKNTEIEAANQILRETLGELQDNFEAMVQAWVRAVEAKDRYTAGHSERVMGYSIAIGRRLELTDHELRVLEMGTLIHDIGKIGIPDEILTKPSRLTDEEIAVIRTHPHVGFRMISNIPLFRECAPIVLWHHEKLDGSGYPDGLRGGEIPLLVRISTVADMFDAMTSARAYRDGMDAQAAFDILRKDAEKGALDPKIVEILAEIVNVEGVLWQSPMQDAA